MPPATPFRRADMLDRLESESFDVLVIGGGITGTGVALDAARAACALPWSSATTSPPGRRRRARSWFTAACATCNKARSAWCTKPCASAATVQERTTSREGAAVHDPHPDQGRRGLAQDRPGDGLGDVDVRPHRRLADRQDAPPSEEGRRVHSPADDAERPPGVGISVLRRHGRRCPVVPHRGPHRSRPRRHGGQPLPRRGTDQERRRWRLGCGGRRRRAADHGACQGDRQRRRCVVRRGAHARRRRRPRLDPTRQGRAHHRSMGEGPQRHRRRHPGAEGQAQPVRGAVGPSRRWHVRACIRRHDRHRLHGIDRRPAMHEGRHQLRARARSTRPSRPA